MVFYKNWGFVNSKKILADALKNHYAVPGYNFNNMEQLQAILEACLETQSPVILQVSKGARDYADETMLQYMAQGGLKMMERLAKEKKLKPIPVVLHLDHGADFDICKEAIDAGFSSVMFDGSFMPYEHNMAMTKKVVHYAHKHDVTVEAELGVLAGIEDGVSAEKSHYTDPVQAEEFVKQTGVDSLAISIGTSHGAYKFTGDKEPHLRLDILEEVKKRLPKTPIVLHGASSVLSEYVKMANQHGGGLKNAKGVPEGEIKAAIERGINKVNVDSDGRLVVTAVIRKILKEDNKIFDPRQYLGPAREELHKMYSRKNKLILGCENRI